MYRGTTPTLTFTVPFTKDDVSVLYITFSQDKEVFSLSLDDVSFVGNEISVKLSQTQTLMFQSGQNVVIQIRARNTDGTAIASNLMYTTVSEILKDGEI